VLEHVREQFRGLRDRRRSDPERSLRDAGNIAYACLQLLTDECDRHGIEWRGRGGKNYHVYSPGGVRTQFSRPVRSDLFVSDPAAFAAEWAALTNTASSKPGMLVMPTREADIDRLVYSAVIGFAAALEAGGSSDRGGPGTFFEIVVGALLALLLDRNEASAIRVPVPGEGSERLSIRTDISFPVASAGDTTLVVPTKISTRERISQAYVHQAILEKADPEHVYRSVLCVGSETNMLGPQPRSVDTAYATDTLVPKTIVMYQRYIAPLSGLYYLDPPHDYVTSPRAGFPPTRQFSTLLSGDLVALIG
jgi:hypothetical protein